MKQIASVGSHGKIISTSTISRRSMMSYPRRKILVSSLRFLFSNVYANMRLDWLSKNITYGLYLSDHSILNDVETELTVLCGIMIQNLPRETSWHLWGIRRIGVSKEDVEATHQCVSFYNSKWRMCWFLQIELVAKFCGIRLHKVPRVADIEHEVWIIVGVS